MIIYYKKNNFDNRFKRLYTYRDYMNIINLL